MYLASIFDTEFEDISDIWDLHYSMTDSELCCVMENFEKEKVVHSTIIEDISMDDDRLCSAVEANEKE